MPGFTIGLSFHGAAERLRRNGAQWSIQIATTGARLEYI